VGIVKARYRSGTGFSAPDVTDVLPKLHVEARKLGADAVIITTVSDHPLGGPNIGYITHPVLEVIAVAIHYTVLPSGGARGPAPSTELAPVEPGGPSLSGSKPTQLTLEGTGSGFAVDRSGHILTNAHVVESCNELRVRASGGVLTTRAVATDSANDLALIGPTSGAADVASFRDGPTLRQGDLVVAVGFPLPQLLASGANVTTGTLSALAGLGDDARYLQVTAPIQPGNSGGPLLDQSGNVVGVVVASLSALKIAKVYGRLPQNVNFAINASVARTFLDANAIRYDAAPSVAKLETADIGERARRFTVLIECWR